MVSNISTCTTYTYSTAPTKVAKEEEELDLSQPPLLVAGLLASAGSAESAYLAFEKLTGGSVTCPVGGCQTALTSAWSTLFGLPLSLYGCAAYAGVAAVSFWGASMASKEQESDEMKTKYARARTLQFLGSCGLAAVSTYLLYVLAFELGGAECIYCLTSASISFTLLAIGISGVRAQEVGRLAPPAVRAQVQVEHIIRLTPRAC